ncbi:MAG TPA: chromosome partition protein MukE [Candidatus Angelobacter sp.]|nr:chromosome partition protein MukE [Candidatus Angelobacter sp.]
MTNASFVRLEEAIVDELFPEVDVDLRSGRHIDRNDADRYTFLVEAQVQLEAFYRRYGCELVHSTDGYFYLVPTGDRLGRRHLSLGEMLIGQTLALAYLEPTTVSTGGIIGREQVLSRLAGLVGERELVQALNPRRKKYDERVAQETVRVEIGKALRGLTALGFIEFIDADHVKLRAPILRFADSVRSLEDPAAALARLVSEGKAVTERQDEEVEDEA